MTMEVKIDCLYEVWPYPSGDLNIFLSKDRDSVGLIYQIRIKFRQSFKRLF